MFKQVGCHGEKMEGEHAWNIVSIAPLAQFAQNKNYTNESDNSENFYDKLIYSLK